MKKPFSFISHYEIKVIFIKLNLFWLVIHKILPFQVNYSASLEIFEK